MKKPWLVPGVPWKSEASFWTWVRGILRKGWSRHPVKIEYINLHRKRIKNPNLKTAKRFPEVWGMKCELCGVDHLQSNIEIDHVGDNAQFTGIDDCKSYVSHLYLVDFDSLRALCKSCHSNVSHAQNTGLSLEEAIVAKRVIAYEKSHSIREIVTYCQEHGYYDCTNQVKRRESLTKIFSRVEPWHSHFE